MNDNRNTPMRTGRTKYYFLLHGGIFIYALTGIFSKYASQQDFFSFKFILFYVLMLTALFLYAIVWQQVLKHVPLTTAFLNKSVTVIWGMFFGAVIFQEAITLKMIVGALIVLLGVCLVVTDDES